jgi:hypothetical protein
MDWQVALVVNEKVEQLAHAHAADVVNDFDLVAHSQTPCGWIMLTLTDL